VEYQVGPFQLQVDQNLVIGEGKQQTIRPKTLELLLYFINHPTETISKQSLLDNIWQSAGAQEHVLFQSVNEIRRLFLPLTVIKTHPRIGYQWVAQVDDISKQQHKTENKQTFIKSKANLLAVLLLSLIPLFLYMSSMLLNNKENPSSVYQTQSPSRELVVLPIENSIIDVDHGWVRLGAMDMMINKLTARKALAVFPAEDVMMALARSDSFDLINIEQKSQAMRSQLGEVVTLHTKLLGAQMEYQLHFSLVGRYQIKQGIVFAEKIPELLEKLAAQVMSHYQYPYDQHRTPISEQTANHNFLQAMELFHRQEYQDAIHHLAIVLKTQPENLKAQRYLLKSMIATGNYHDAQRIGDQIQVMAENQQDQQESLRITFELGVLASLRGDFEIAHQLISKSRSLAEAHGDQLYAAYSHTQLGHLLQAKAQLPEAKILYQKALEYHQGFQCPYGQISNLNALATVHQQQKSPEQAEQKLNQAISIAKTNGLTFEHAHLLINKIKLFVDHDERKLWLSQAEILINKLENTKIKQQLVARINELSLLNTQIEINKLF
jgi:DNA-binding winged helix-turn-helix (wHTH) protein/tetratricopeptide (TPR) repeat protein